MKIGYPCINTSVGCTANTTFRLKSYSEEKLVEKVRSNLVCLRRILEFNVERGLLFFRIGSELVPFASHPVCEFGWVECFGKEFKEIGDYVVEHGVRISMHPDQFVLVNAKDPKIVESSFRELGYHCSVLDAMGLDATAKVQIHVGGVYGDKAQSISRFVENYGRLGERIKKRLVIENDDRSYSLKDCLGISRQVKVPVLFDVFHHQCLNDGETVREGIASAVRTWGKKDGRLMVDYSSQKAGGKRCSHTESIDMPLFKKFLAETRGFDFDVMLEIKDKERSALKAVKALNIPKR